MMKKIFKKKSFQALALGFLMTVLLMLLVGSNSMLLQTSVLNLPDHKAFDGTTYPVELVPDWVHLDADNYKSTYSVIGSLKKLIKVPYYDPAQLKKSVSNLVWGNASDDKVRNAKITYSVPYLGNYKLDGVEYGGSHPAVDIKIPLNTPVFAIANGVIAKASNQEDGFGHHIVIQHNNFPSLDNESKKDVIYSSYSHLNTLLVSEGDVVIKGQQIAYSGSTGTSTTPHLHFQIDNSSAPWHPYWPFTWKEAQDAGLDFYSAINAGLGADKAKLTTINPLMYVQKYLDRDVVNSVVEEVVVKPVVKPVEKVIKDLPAASVPSAGAGSYVGVLDKTDNTDVKVEDTVVSEVDVVEIEKVVEEVKLEEVRDPSVINFEFEVDESYLFDENGKYKFKVLMRDQYGDVYNDGFSDSVLVATENSNVRVDKTLVNNMSFGSDGVLENSFTLRKSGQERFKINYDGKEFTSDWFDVIEVDAESRFKDIRTNNKYYDAIEYLADEGVISGYDDKTFRPNQTVTRVEALKFIFEGTKANLEGGDLSFSDLDDSPWYSEYLFTAMKKNVVKGYDDGSFKPHKTVNKAEFLKMLFLGMGVDVEEKVSYSPFMDVKMKEWYAPYFIKAYELGIIDDSSKYINPSVGMTRGEVADAIYKVMTLED